MNIIITDNKSNWSLDSNDIVAITAIAKDHGVEINWVAYPVADDCDYVAEKLGEIWDIWNS